MTTDSIINQIKLQSPKGLAKTYEGICEEYRKRLCDQWEILFDETWWHGDKSARFCSLPIGGCH